MSYFNTNSANAPGPNDPTYNGAPFADEAALLSGAGVAASASRGLVGGITAFARQAGDEALALARAGAQQVSRVYQAASNTALNRSQSAYAHITTRPIYTGIANRANSALIGEALIRDLPQSVLTGEPPLPGPTGLRDFLPQNPYSVPAKALGSGLHHTANRLSGYFNNRPRSSAFGPPIK